VPDRGVVLVDPTNVGALAQALDHLAANPEQVAAMRADLMPLAQMDRHKNRASEILNWMQHILSQPPE
jgi:glycosyltransferase involved in cell wall biosynthesis